MSRRLAFIVFFCCLFNIGPSFVFGQNLVINGDFEAYEECPNGIGKVRGYLKGITTPTEGSSDYFNSCATGKNGVPRNFRGYQAAQSGEGYMGIYVFAPNYYREYLQMELKQPLVAGRTYTLEFHISVAEDSNYAIERLGALFTDTKLSFGGKSIIRSARVAANSNVYHINEIKLEDVLSGKENWIPVKFEFIAKGSEKFLSVGNFSQTSNGGMLRFPGDKKKTKTEYSYYYIDAVSLKQESPMDLEYDSVFILENVHFDTDSHYLDEPSKEYLTELYDLLSDPTRDKVLLRGHTDRDGSNAYNQLLSYKRVNAVADYLVQMGVPAENISTESFGEGKPLNNGSNSGKKRLNRRVEFVITEFEDY